MAGSASRENGKKGGRPLGAKSAATVTKEQAREAFRLLVMEHFAPLVAAQVAHAQGLKYLVAREKATGKFSKLTQEKAEKILSGEDDSFDHLEVWEKDPSVQAFTDLMNRTLDKPKEQVIEIKDVSDDHRIQRLQGARKRGESK